MITGRREDIEFELKKLGWTNKEWKCSEVHVFQEYRPNKKIRPELPWEFVVYTKTPVWEWDFVEFYTLGRKIGEGAYDDYNPSKGSWIHNERLDFEFETNEDARTIALEMDRQRREDIEAPIFDHKDTWPWKVAVQKVADRPTKEQLNG